MVNSTITRNAVFRSFLRFFAVPFARLTVSLVFVLGIITSCSQQPQTAQSGATSACEIDRPVVFGGLDWDSNAFHTEVARFIIEHGFECETEIIPGTTLPLNNGIVRGDIDILMEIWKNSQPEVWTRGVERGVVRSIGVNFPDAVQGIFVPRYMVEGDAQRGIDPVAPDLKTIFDLPAHKDLFRDPEEPTKGRFYNCVLGWVCETVNTKKLAAYGLNDSFTNFRSGTGAALDAAVAGAYKRGEPIVFYYWGPTWVLGVYDLVMLEEPAFDPVIWKTLQAEDNPTAAVAYPMDEVSVGVNVAFAQEAPTLTDFLRNYRTSNALVSEALAFIQEEDGRQPIDAALYFLNNRRDLWSKWIDPETANKIDQALANQME